MLKICPGFGARYEVCEIQLPMRDQDSFECDVCDTKVMRWNGASMFSFKRIVEDKNDEK